ncbi:MAG: CBS domain-containing protein [Deltaproteobacteria bacterium]|jgi:chloride channel protein, CIC family|nr:CBS domain-containing protein [Deltaproteobacteria bacterium]MBT4268041.1 CBS domain-containing protein [Deltaproteobacteria bacterium]MBT4641491.1 CBS domain-containing protein [Deltaproteobacteria bacterium]MBT6503563.1 CBS domain-containing protein [Deltaproteobacteria bacterium]MBT6615675.1 CBS domain-containing protein [Deltaproteobacteria bacterium]
MLNKINDYYKTCSRLSVSMVEKAKMTEHTFMIIIAILIGVFAGFGAIGIRMLIQTISDFSFAGSGSLLENIIAAPWYIKISIPVIGGLIVGPLIYFFAPEAKGHGVPEVMQSILLKGGIIRPRVAFVKAIASAVTIGTGGSVGREGPIIQIGSSLGSTVGQFFNISGDRMKTLVGCGAAAGIAAAFNAPIAGALFAVEIILMDFAFAQFSPIVISSVMATVISHKFEGNLATFQVPHYELVNPTELIFYVILGLLAGLVSYVFIKVLYAFEDFFENNVPIPEYLQPVIGGLVIGVTALLFPQIMGVGYDTINNALHGDMIWYMAFSLIFIKILATSFTLGSGGSGGIFAPSLFMGAMLGCFFGTFVHEMFPSISASPGAYALVAMGGLVAGTTRAPITAIIIVFELTNDYNIILPLMITCIISTILSSKLSRESIYTLKLLLRKINLKGGTEINVMKSLYVRDLYQSSFESIPETSSFAEVVNQVITKRDPYFLVMDDSDLLVGIISIHDMKSFMFEGEDLQNLIIAGDIALKDIKVVGLDEDCQTALDKMSKTGFLGLPIVQSDNNRKVLGMIWQKDVLDAYHTEIERRDVAATLVDRIQMSSNRQDVHFMEGYSISEIAVPKTFIGKSIKDLNIRAIYGIDVLSIRQQKGQGMEIKAFPGPDYILRADDFLTIAGLIKKLNLIKNLE